MIYPNREFGSVALYLAITKKRTAFSASSSHT
jgi:hypothetical protein